MAIVNLRELIGSLTQARVLLFGAQQVLTSNEGKPEDTAQSSRFTYHDDAAALGHICEELDRIRSNYDRKPEARREGA